MVSLFFGGWPLDLESMVARETALPLALDAAYKRAWDTVQQLGGKMLAVHTGPPVFIATLVPLAVALEIRLYPDGAQQTRVAVSGARVQDRVSTDAWAVVDRYVALLQGPAT